MKRLSDICITLLLVACLAISAGAQSGKTPITNEDVQQMLSQGVADDVVIQSISANDVNFDVSPAALMALKKANVSDKVVQAMLAAESSKREAATQKIAAATQSSHSGHNSLNPNMPSPNQQGVSSEVQLPKVSLILNDSRQLMNPSGTEVAAGKGKGGSGAGSVAKGFGKGLLIATNMAGVPVPHGGGRGPATPNVARNWALPGRNSQFTIQSATPKFELEFGSLPGVDPDAYEPVLLKLVQTKDNWRMVSTSRDKFDKHGNDTRSDKIKPENKVLIAVNMLGRGHLIVTPATDLAPGEYGLLLHPKKAEKEYAGVTDANADAIFYSVWDFSLGAPQAASTETAKGH
jgi:hypothetical protein